MLMARKRNRSLGWDSIFGLPPKKSPIYDDLSNRRKVALDELSNFIAMFNGKFLWDKADAIMQKIQIIDQSIIEEHKNSPNLSLHDLLSNHKTNSDIPTK